MRVSALAALFWLGACASPGIDPEDLTQAQLNAIETRMVEANMEETFTAASHALFDAGYVIAMSDREGGLLTGTRSLDRSTERFFFGSSFKDRHYAVSMQVRKTGWKSCEVRIHTTINGEARVDKDSIDQIWVLMQRQVLMKGPPPRR
ncbi:MAG: hypothetical protein ACYTGV_10010 [Planctomycetota bacterium]|jgi:hypothetical protein